jgi:hypothetical protein
MYCRSCGVRLPEGSAFCPTCGTAQAAVERAGTRQPMQPVLAIVLMILFLPFLPLIVWKGTDWSEDTKFAVAGLMAPQLWAYFVWKQSWDLWVRVAGVAALEALYLFVMAAVAGPTGVELGALFSVPLLAVALGWRPGQGTSTATPAPQAAGERGALEAKLALCNDLIAEIEGAQGMRALPVRSSEFDMYMHGLDLRAHGAQLLDGARSTRDFQTVDRTLTEALHELRAARDVLAGS